VFVFVLDREIFIARDVLQPDVIFLLLGQLSARSEKFRVLLYGLDYVLCSLSKVVLWTEHVLFGGLIDGDFFVVVVQVESYHQELVLRRYCCELIGHGRKIVSMCYWLGCVTESQLFAPSEVLLCPPSQLLQQCLVVVCHSVCDC